MQKLLLSAPIGGWLVDLPDVPDPAFAGGMIGEGTAIDPLEAHLCAPCDGEITSVANARHAVTLRAENGAEILIHVGIDTVEAQGRGLTLRVEAGQRVRQGDALVDIALDELLNHATSLVTPIVIVNAQEYSIVQCRAAGPVERGVPLLEVLPAAKEAVETADSHAAPEVTEEIVVALPHGVHARPAARIVQLSRQYSARLTLSLNERRADTRSMVALMALGAGHGDRVQVDGAGADARQALRAVAAVLATPTVESTAPAKASPETATAVEGDETSRAGSNDRVIRGTVASRGLAIGSAQRLRRTRFDVNEKGEGTDRERGNLRRAIQEALTRARSVQLASGNDILAAQLELLGDPALLADADTAIELGKSAAYAWQGAIARAGDTFTACGDDRIAERVADLRDIEEQVLQVLAGAGPAADYDVAHDAILLVDDLLPSQLCRLDSAKVAGFCCAGGGPTSHVALMAAARGIPAIVGAGPRILRIAEGTRLVLDAERGLLLVDPDEPVIAEMKASIRARRDARAAHLRAAARDACTSDGVRIEILANLASEAEARQAATLGAEGCGLLRTELLYLDRELAPTEAEQAEHYQAIARALGDRPLTIRTLDVGGDKPLAYLPLPAEENPLLGLRGLRASLRFPGLLRDQLAAILRIEPLSQCRILLPMVTEPGEIRTVRSMLAQLIAEHRPGASIAVGAMIETPASVALAAAIAREADFLSIGTNDLAQYTLAMDRTHPALAGSFDHLHPAVLHQVATVCDAAAKAGRNVSVCGALASEPLAVPILIGLGVRALSVVPAMVPEVKALVRELTLGDCRTAGDEVLAMEDSASVRQYAEALLRQLQRGRRP